MKLLTKEIAKKLPKLGATDGTDGVVVAKFFTPDANWTWYVTEGEPRGNGDWELFGLVDGHELELGHFLLSEVEELRGPLGLPVERDAWWSEKKVSEVKKENAEVW